MAKNVTIPAGRPDSYPGTAVTEDCDQIAFSSAGKTKWRCKR